MLLIVSLLLLACRPDTRVNGSMRTPPEIPEQPNLASITSWEGKIVAFSDSFDAKTRKWKKVPLILDTQTRQLSRWTEGGHSPLGVSQNEHSSAYAFDSSGRVGIRIRRSTDSLLILTTAPTERYQGHQVEGNALVVVTRDSIHFKSESTAWRAIANTVEGDFPDLLLKDGALYLGSDNGEWEGIAARIDLAEAEPVIDTLFQGNVNQIESDSAGKIWFAGGLSHLSMVSCFLRTYSKGIQEVILDQMGMDFGDSIRIDLANRPKLAFDSLADIRGLQLFKGRVFILTDSGVFLVGEEISPFLEFPFHRCYPFDGFTACSSPVGLLMLEDRSYIATRSLGLLELTQANQSWTIRQLLTVF